MIAISLWRIAMIARACLAFLLLTGGQSLVSAFGPPKIPDYYVIPIGDDEPGGGGGGTLNCAGPTSSMIPDGKGNWKEKWCFTWPGGSNCDSTTRKQAEDRMKAKGCKGY